MTDKMEGDFFRTWIGLHEKSPGTEEGEEGGEGEKENQHPSLVPGVSPLPLYHP